MYLVILFENQFFNVFHFQPKEYCTYEIKMTEWRMSDALIVLFMGVPDDLSRLSRRQLLDMYKTIGFKDVTEPRNDQLIRRINRVRETLNYDNNFGPLLKPTELEPDSPTYNWIIWDLITNQETYKHVHRAEIWCAK